MMEVDDTVIKLFGKKITLPDNGRYSAGESSTATVDHENSSPHHDCILLKISKAACLDDKKVDRVVEEEAQKDHLSKESTNSKPLPESDDNHPKTPSIDEEIETLKPPKTENDPTNSEKKTLKKPDKILPCPRCNSTDTKFCYYNNYNINQPRHFCKSCQRYWTSGGTMRNVPVGAGRRKYKNPASYCLHNHIHNIVSDEALEAALVHAPNGIVHAPNGILRPNFKPNGTVLSFNLGSQLCESMACVLGLAEKMAPNGTQNGIYKLEQGILVEGEENGNDFASVSSITSSNSMMEGVRKGIQEPRMQNTHGFPSRVQCFPGVPWPCPWNSTVPVSGIPIPFYASPYWNCNIPGTSIQTVPNSGLKSPALGKHSRNGDLINRINPKVEDKNCERPILVPRTLRIDDPDDAAKSSIWETLGIKNDSMCRGTFFKASQPKGEHVTTAASPVLQANPAAMSRSLSFQERA